MEAVMIPLLLTLSAHAQEAPSPEPQPEPTPVAAEALPSDNLLADDPDRLVYEVSLRARYLSVPRGMMDLWYTDADGSGWPLPGQQRPMLHAVAYGVEFAVQRRQTMGIFYVDVVQSLMDEGYWDDHDDPVEGWTDGDWLRPTGFFGAITFGANGAYDAPIVKFDQTKDRFAMSFVVGGGLGLAVLVGGLDQWSIDRTDGTPSYDRVARGDAPDGRTDLKSPVWPMVDFSMGFKFYLSPHVVMRLEGGLHTGLFYGGSIGGRF